VILFWILKEESVNVIRTGKSLVNLLMDMRFLVRCGTNKTSSNFKFEESLEVPVWVMGRGASFPTITLSLPTCYSEVVSAVESGIMWEPSMKPMQPWHWRRGMSWLFHSLMVIMWTMILKERGSTIRKKGGRFLEFNLEELWNHSMFWENHHTLSWKLRFIYTGNVYMYN
jgi:hypothetical protein